jgi:type II secretory pathway component PulF
MFNITNIAKASGVIDDAPSIPELLLNILNFLLQIFGIIAIIALAISGIIYLTAYGDEDRIKLAKKSVTYSIIGTIVALSGMVVIKTISGLLK